MPGMKSFNVIFCHVIFYQQGALLVGRQTQGLQSTELNLKRKLKALFLHSVHLRLTCKRKDLMLIGTRLKNL